MIIPSFKAGIFSFIRKVVQSIPLGTKGSLYVFGESLDGSLGLSDNISRSIPVQLGTDTNWSKISGGRNFFLAINSDGAGNNRLWAWGRNNYGQLGLGDKTNRSSPVQIGTDTDWASLGIGATNSFAIKSGGSIWAWGNNYYGRLGLNNTTSRSSPVQIGALTNWSTVSSGSYSTLSIKTDGSLWAWGRNINGEMGTSNTTTRSSPVQVGTDTNWSKVDIQFYHTVAVKTNGTLWTWGNGSDGRLGHGNTTNRSSPVQVGTDTNWASVATGSTHTLAIKTTGTLWAWGSNSVGELGLGNTTNRSSPVQVGTDTNWSSVSAGSNVTLATKTNGTLWAWGRLRENAGLGILYTLNISRPILASTSTNWEYSGIGLSSTNFSIDKNTSGNIWAQGSNSSGQFGDSSSTTRSSPVQIGTSTDWSVVRCGGSFSTGRRSNGTLWSWGNNGFGQLGHGNTTNRSSPVQIGTDTNWSTNFSCGYNFCIAIKNTGTLWAWGNPTNFYLGNGDNNTRRSSPVQIGSDSDWSSVRTGNGHSLALKTNGTLWGWGRNNYGQVGNNAITLISRSSPVQLGSDANWSQVSIGQRHALAVKSTGAMWVWGNSSDSGFGTGNVSSPIQVGSSTDWSKAQASRQFSIALKTTGTLWGWGSNIYGQIGIGNTSTYSSPRQIGTDTNWSSNFNCGSRHTIAIRTTGTLWSWGRNSYGQLGLGNTTNRSSPVQIGTDTDWASLGTGNGHSLARKTTGTLWGWGLNTSGELGLGNTTNRSSPVQIGTDTNWASVSSGGSHTLAIKTTGTLWSWGGNAYGQLGQGNTTSRSSPVQIGTDTNWAFCKAGIRSSLAVKTNGTLWSWGRNTLGELGLGNATNRSSPVQIGTNTDWLTTTDNISPNYSSSFAVLNSSNNIFVFGYNLQGQLGVSQNAAVSPVQIGSDTNWSSFDAGNNISAAVKTTGTLWAWGQNSYGQLGLRDTTNRSSPVQVGTDTNWSSVRCGYNFTVGLKTTGTLWSWGRNNIGQLGLGNAGTNRSSPVQIGTDTDWSLIFTRRYISKAIKTNGTLWAWGANSYGSAMPLNRHVSSPIQVGTDSTWIIVEVDKYKTTAAVKS